MDDYPGGDNGDGTNEPLQPPIQPSDPDELTDAPADLEKEDEELKEKGDD